MIKEVHAKIVKHKRPVIIITEQEDTVEFPEHEDIPEFEDIYIIDYICDSAVTRCKNSD